MLYLISRQICRHIHTYLDNCTIHLDRDVFDKMSMRFDDFAQKRTKCDRINSARKSSVCGYTEINAKQLPLMYFGLFFLSYLLDMSMRPNFKIRQENVMNVDLVARFGALTTDIEPSFNTTRILYLANPINSSSHFVCAVDDVTWGDCTPLFLLPMKRKI